MIRKFFFPLLLTLLFLTGCSDETIPATSEEKFGVNEEIINETSNSNKKLQYIKHNADYYENGVVFGNDTAMFLDYDTMEKAPLCAAPNCTHNNSSCLANTVGTTPIMYNDSIYYFDSIAGVNETPDGREFYIDSKLMKATLDSSETEIVCEFTDCSPPIVNAHYLLADNILYFVGDDMCPIEDEYGGISYSNVGGTHFLCSINLDTGKYENYGSIYDEDKEFEMAVASSGANITGYYEGKMYLQYLFMKEDPVVLGIAPEENWTRVNFEFDLESKELTESELPAAIFMDEDTYVYVDNNRKLTTIIDGTEKYDIPHFNLMSMNASVFNNKIFFTDKWFELTNLTEHNYGEYEGYEVVGYHDDCYILIKGGKTAKLTEEELLALDKE
ncbi:MAG: hypothetical protein IJN57_02450 [Oscillospiraceae bacterium]|nr:hypothetical protein [Oscillospiraceae bacterium]